MTFVGPICLVVVTKLSQVVIHIATHTLLQVLAGEKSRESQNGFCVKTIVPLTS